MEVWKRVRGLRGHREVVTVPRMPRALPELQSGPQTPGCKSALSDILQSPLKVAECSHFDFDKCTVCVESALI